MTNSSHIEQKCFSGYLRDQTKFKYFGSIFPSASSQLKFKKSLGLLWLKLFFQLQTIFTCSLTQGFYTTLGFNSVQLNKYLLSVYIVPDQDAVFSAQFNCLCVLDKNKTVSCKDLVIYIFTLVLARFHVSELKLMMFYFK